jgi:hypothetical protein
MPGQKREAEATGCGGGVGGGVGGGGGGVGGGGGGGEGQTATRKQATDGRMEDAGFSPFRTIFRYELSYICGGVLGMGEAALRF